MNDREKVLKGLKACIVQNPDDRRDCESCPYRRRGITNEPCFNGLMIGALALLEAQKPEPADTTNPKGGSCSTCKHEYEDNENYCRMNPRCRVCGVCSGYEP